MKITVGDTDGQTHQIEIEDSSQLTGKKSEKNLTAE